MGNGIEIWYFIYQKERYILKHQGLIVALISTISRVNTKDTRLVDAQYYLERDDELLLSLKTH